MEKIDLPDWAGGDWVVKTGREEELEEMIIVATKKINEIIDWINAQ